VDLTARTTLQRERGEDDSADVVGNLVGPVQNGSIVWIRLFGLFRVVSAISVQFTRNSDTRILGFDEDRSSGSLDCLTQVRCEALVPLRQSVDWSGTVSKPSCSQSSGRWMRYLTSAVSWLHPWSSFRMNIRKRVSIS
jgi:hypothetical protein